MTPATLRRLAVVACCTVTGEPDGTHLTVEEWSPRWQEWLTGIALCGQSAEQGALPAGTAVTCTSCEGYRDHYERALAGRPTAEHEELARLRGLIAELEAHPGVVRSQGASTDPLEGLADPFQAGAAPCQQYCPAGPCAPSCLRMNDPSPIPMDDDRMQRTAARIRAVREGLDTQAPNISLRRATEVYHGRSAPTAAELVLYAEACEVTVDLLLTGVGFKAARAAAQEKL